MHCSNTLSNEMIVCDRLGRKIVWRIRQFLSSSGIDERCDKRMTVIAGCRIPAVFWVRFFPDFIITETALGWARFLRLWQYSTLGIGRGGGICGRGRCCMRTIRRRRREWRGLRGRRRAWNRGGWRILNTPARLRVAYPLRFCFVPACGGQAKGGQFFASFLNQPPTMRLWRPALAAYHP